MDKLLFHLSVSRALVRECALGTALQAVELGTHRFRGKKPRQTGEFKNKVPLVFSGYTIQCSPCCFELEIAMRAAEGAVQR